jgi:hypothetical protein
LAKVLGKAEGFLGKPWFLGTLLAELAERVFWRAVRIKR